MSRSLDELLRRKNALGNIGALDHLIAIEQKRLETPSNVAEFNKLLHSEEISTKQHGNRLLAGSQDQSLTLIKALKDSLLLNKALESELKKLVNEKDQLLKKCEDQEKRIYERFQELAILSRMLMNKNHETEK
jgi:hypothetical protein